MKSIRLLLPALALLLGGCVSLNSVSETQIPAERDHEIKAEASRLIILGLNFDNDFVDDVRTQLKNECKGGEVRGILTKDEMINYFIFVQRRRVTAAGYCLKDDGRSA